MRPPTWLQRDVPSLGIERLTGVALGPDGFVTVGFNGTIATSVDGARWTARPSGTPLDLYSVAYGNGVFAAVGQTILSSSNALDWVVRDSGPNYDFETVAFLNNAFMAVGANGTIKVSTDGLDWSTRSAGTTATLYGIAHGNDTYVVVGAGGELRTSQEGINWTARTSGTVQDLNGVRYANGLFVAQGHFGVILTSTDGAGWVPQTSGTGQGLATSGGRPRCHPPIRRDAANRGYPVAPRKRLSRNHFFSTIGPDLHRPKPGSGARRDVAARSRCLGRRNEPVG